MIKTLATTLGISDRVEVMSKAESYVTVKDTKPDFENNPKFRLLNPNKGNIGKFIKEISQDINNQLRAKTEYNQWKNSSEVIKWFTKIDSKDRSTFILFDIDQFYPSITEKLLNEALDWALNFVVVSEEKKSYFQQSKTCFIMN